MHNDQFSHPSEKPTVHEHGVTGYEKRDVVAMPVVKQFAWLVIITVVSAIVALWVWRDGEAGNSQHSVAITPTAEERSLPPLPRLQERPSVDIQAYREAEHAQISGYKWIDKTAGIVQIPVERALEIVAEKGLPHGRDAHIPGASQQPAAAPAATPVPPLVPAAAPETAPEAL
ncbi:MAG TPA: hypothetical protein PK869_07445 [Candidatus Hydrogenedentes bacterium]|nr:hypothetical protein [Candidatus Hydrogenedentota bacterium]